MRPDLARLFVSLAPAARRIGLKTDARGIGGANSTSYSRLRERRENMAAHAPTSWAPTAKVSVGVMAASATTLALSLSKQFTGHDLSAADAAAITTLVTFAIQYWVPERK